MEEDEQLDLVDDNDQVIGTIWRSEYGQILKDKKGNIRSADAFLINNEGKLWIPRRNANKTIAPNGLDFSMGEHVQPGETYLEACIRGFKEELNLDIKPTEVIELTKFKPMPGKLAYFNTLFLYKSNTAPNYNKHDFYEYYWLTPTELIKKIKNGELAKTNLLRNTKFLLEYLRVR